MIRRAKKKLMLQYDSTVSFFADALTRMRAHEGFKRYFKNTGWLFLGQLFTMGVGFFVGVYVARYLGPREYGSMNYAISFSSLFGFLAGFGVDNILNRELVKYPEKKDLLLSNSFWLKFIGGILAVVIINTTFFFIDGDYSMRWVIFIFSLTFLFQSFAIVNIYFQSQVLSKKVVPVQLVVTFLSASIKLVFIWLNFGIIPIIAIYLFDAMSLSVGLALVYYKNYKNYISFSINRDVLKFLLRDSLPLMFTAIAVTVYSKIDQVIIRYALDNVSVGIYSAAVRLVEIWYIVPATICASLFPAIINSKNNKMVYKKRLRKLFLVILALSLVIVALTILFADPIIGLLFGPSYFGSISVLKLYIWSIIPSFIMVIVNYYLVTENYTKIYFLITLYGAIVNVILNLLLIPRYNIIGSVIATLISYSTVPFSLVFFKKTREQILLFLSPDTVN